jgi:hypothetical protein
MELDGGPNVRKAKRQGDDGVRIPSEEGSTKRRAALSSITNQRHSVAEPFSGVVTATIAHFSLQIPPALLPGASKKATIASVAPPTLPQAAAGS